MFDIKEFEIAIPANLVNSIIEFSKIHVGEKYTNIGGWHSSTFRSKMVPDWAKEIVNSVLTVIDQPLQECWFNINGPGHYNRWHGHSKTIDVAVVYVQVPENSGNIEFRKDNSSYFITPTEGKVLLFPGGLEHQVLPNMSADSRISIALNLHKYSIDLQGSK